MDPIFFYFIILGVKVLICSGLQGQCSTNYFYDSVTKSCAPCLDICDQADIQGTSEHCRQECPRYKLLTHTSTTTTTTSPPVPQTLPIELVLACAIIGCIVISITSLLFYKRCRSNNQQVLQEQDVEHGTFCLKDKACLQKKNQTNQHQQNLPEEIALTDPPATDENECSDAVQPWDDDSNSKILPSAAQNSQCITIH